MVPKLAYLLMVFAISNPFCCCTAADLFAGSSESAPMHSCCGGGTEERSAEDEHDPANCPHRVLDDYETVSHQDKGASNPSLSLPQVLFILYDLRVYDSVLWSTRLKVQESTLGPPPVPLSQVYCVYTI